MTIYTKTFTHPNPEIKETFTVTVEVTVGATKINDRILTFGRHMGDEIAYQVERWKQDQTQALEQEQSLRANGFEVKS